MKALAAEIVRNSARKSTGDSNSLRKRDFSFFDEIHLLYDDDRAMSLKV